MAKRPIQLALTMSNAINYKHHCHTVVNTTKFFDKRQDRMVTLYSISDSFREKDGQYVTKKLYQTSSSVFLCYFLQELMYAFEDREFEPPRKQGYMKGHEEKGVSESIEYMLRLYKDGQ